MRTATVFLSLSAVALATSIAVAGPPMICHPVEVGDAGEAECLPWGDKPFKKSRRFRTSELVGRTITALDGSSSALVHLETLRRAALYSDNDADLAGRLIGGLMARALDAEAGSADASLAWLDAGYLAQCYDQLGVRTGVQYGMADGIVGYAWVRRSLALSPDDAEFEFAAAMMTARAGGTGHEQHVARARKLAAPDSLVSRNLEVHANDHWPHHRHAGDSPARSRRTPG